MSEIGVRPTVMQVAREREDVVVGDEIVRHKFSSRVIHWMVALFFFTALLTGMPIWSPVFGWMAYFFGGLTVCRWLHPWAGIAFAVASLVMFVDWLAQMRVAEHPPPPNGRQYPRSSRTR